VVLFLKSLVAG